MLFRNLAMIDGLANEELNYWLNRAHTQEGLLHIAELLSEVAISDGPIEQFPPFKDDDFVIELDTELGNLVLSFALGEQPFAALTEIID